MTKVICLFSKKELKTDTLFDSLNRREEYLENQIENKDKNLSFDEIIAKNKEAEKKLKEEREAVNKNVLKSYQLK